MKKVVQMNVKVEVAKKELISMLSGIVPDDAEKLVISSLPNDVYGVNYTQTHREGTGDPAPKKDAVNEAKSPATQSPKKA